LNIDTNNNALDIELAKSVSEYFQLTQAEMNNIIVEVTTVVSNWKAVAQKIGISRAEQELMSAAFRF
jgi:serine/threonine-protein kinase HipA